MKRVEFTACWDLSDKGRCRKPKDHDGPHAYVPHSSDRVQPQAAKPEVPTGLDEVWAWGS